MFDPIRDGILSFPNSIAREVIFEKCDGFAIRSRVFLVGDWLYMLMGISDTETSVDATRFMNSFKLIGK